MKKPKKQEKETSDDPKPTLREQEMMRELREENELRSSRLARAAEDKRANGGNPPPPGLMDLIVGR